jgi:cell division protein FtsZ
MSLVDSIDFSDIQAIAPRRCRAMMGMGVSKGENRVVKAAQGAIASMRLEESSMKSAQGILINILGGQDLGLREVEQATSVITQNVNADTKVIFNTAVNTTDSDEVTVTIIVAGF